MRNAVAILALLATVGCSGDSSGPCMPADTLTLSTVSGQNLTGMVGSHVSSTVRLENSCGVAQPSRLLTFTPQSGDATSGTTDDNGEATVIWTLRSIGTNTLTVSSADADGALTLIATGTQPPITGTWSGVIANSSSGTIQLVLVETGGQVTGSGSVGNTAVTASGLYTHPNLSVTVTEGGLHPPANIIGTVNGATFRGTITGSGFSGNTVTLTRQ